MVAIDLRLADGDADAIDEVIHRVWAAGDPDDTLDAIVVVNDVRLLEGPESTS